MSGGPAGARRSWRAVAGLGAALLGVGLAGVGCDDAPSARCGDGRCDAPAETVASCPADCGPRCGNGRLETEAGEACDGTDVGGLDCAAVGCGTGRLACDAQCQLDYAGCSAPCGGACGDGVRDPGEQCDCGLDPYRLPALCPAPNGDPLGICTAGCTWSRRCGNQVVDAGEACDCGLDPDTLPAGCSAPNGWYGGECDAACLPAGRECTVDHHYDCDRDLPDSQCCPDAWGSPALCYEIDAWDAICVLACDSTADCHYNNYCDPNQEGCFPWLCGPSFGGPPFFADCQPEGGQHGICIPVDLAELQFGLCFENSENAIPPGEPCAMEYLFASFPRDSGLDTCLDGICYDAANDGYPHCHAFCNWQDVYDHDTNDAWCPRDTNCVSQSAILASETDPDYRGRRSSDIAICQLTRDADSNAGLTACDLLRGELIADRALTCGSWRSGTICQPIQAGAGGDPYWGTLIGACLDSGGATPAAVWAPCTPGTLCAEGSSCFPEDAFATTPQGPWRCVPLCDTAATAPCAPAHPEIPSGNQCRSLSAYFLPGSQPGTSADGSPSRVGLCALPPS